MISREKTVRRRRFRDPERREEQHLVETVRLFGLPIWRRILDREEIPDWALIQIGAFGSTEWRSKFAEFIR